MLQSVEASSGHVPASAVLKATALRAEWLRLTSSAPTNAHGTGFSCNSSLHGDAPVEGCGSFCKESKARDHCRFCKCRACSYCGRTQRSSQSSEYSPSQSALPSSTPFAMIVTSVYLPHLLKRRSNGFALTLFSRARLNAFGASGVLPPYTLRVRAYFDGPGTPPPELDQVQWVPLELTQPWSVNFVQSSLRKNSTVASLYRSRRYTCIQPSPDFASCNDVYTAYKVAAIYDAIARAVAHYVIWLDVDTWFQQPLNAGFWSFVTRFAVATIGSREPHHPETGILVLDSTRTQELVWLAKQAFTDTSLASLIGGLNDVQIFGFLLARMGPTGWFAVGCRSPRWLAHGYPMNAPWLIDARSYETHRYQFCTIDAANPGSTVSPFNLLEYITHLKNQSGPIQHNAGGAAPAGALNFCRQAGRNRTHHCGLNFLVA